MNEVEKKVRAEFDKLLECDHGVSKVQDQGLLTGLWWFLYENYSEDVADVCNRVGQVGDLVEFAVEQRLYKRYISSGREEPLDGGVQKRLGDQDAYFDEILEDEGMAPDNNLKKTVRNREAAFSKYLSKVAAIEPSVVRFRDRVLGGPTNVLSPEKATEFLHSLAAAQQPGDPQEAEKLVWSGNEKAGDTEHITVWPGSELWILKNICRTLAKKYRWSEDQACYLILTDRPVKAITSRRRVSRTSAGGVAGHQYSYATITLEMPAWMPSEYVRLAYRIAQRDLLGENNRQPELRNVKLFEFVVEQSELEIVDKKEGLAKLTIPEWKRLRELWNQRYREGHAWHYGRKKEHRFSRDFYRAQEAVIGTPHGLPGPPSKQLKVKGNLRRMLERFRQPGAAFVEADEEIR